MEILRASVTAILRADGVLGADSAAVHARGEGSSAVGQPPRWQPASRPRDRLTPTRGLEFVDRAPVVIPLQDLAIRFARVRWAGSRPVGSDGAPRRPTRLATGR